MKLDKIFYSKIFKKYEVFITSVIVVIAVSGLTFKLLIPNILRAREINDNGKNLQRKVLALENKKKILTGVDDNLMRENFSKLNYVVPDNKDYVFLFTTLDNLQQKLGVSITRTDFQLGLISTTSALLKKNKKENNFIVPINLEVIGSVDQLRSFLEELSNLSGRLITTDQIKIESMDFGLVKAYLSGKTYYNPLPKQIGSVDSKLPEFNQDYEKIFNRIRHNQYPVDILEETREEVPVGKDNLFL